MKKIISFSILLLLVGIKIFAQTSVNSEQQGKSKDKKTGCDFFTFNSQSRTGMWTGGCSNGFINGSGIMKIYQNDTLIFISNCNYTNGYKNGYTIDSSIIYGFVYSGFCVNGNRDGKGKIVYKAGDYYEGDFKEGKLEGKGKFTYTNGSIYEGEWKDNMRKNGKMVFPNGTYYEGDFNEDNFEGKGKLVSKDGSSYEGDFKNNKSEGKGKYVYADGSVYEGDFKDNKNEGNGKYVSYNGSYYIGDWKDDKTNGKGKYVYADGSIYEGDFKDNKSEGKGKKTNKDGSYYDGDWMNNEANGKGKYVYADGSIYEGDWKNGKIEGTGKFVWADKSYYEGEMKDGLKQGNGKYVWADGSYYLGEWKYDKRDGNGISYNKNGNVEFEGQFENGKPIQNNSNSSGNSSSSIIDKIFASLTPSERQYVEKLLQSNDDPKGIVDTKCGVSYSKCKWCGKMISYNKTWASKIQSIKAFKDPYMSALGGLFMGVGGALGGYSEGEMVEKWSRDLKKDIREIKAGNIYFCHEGTAPKFCSKKCEYEFSYH